MKSINLLNEANLHQFTITRNLNPTITSTTMKEKENKQKIIVISLYIVII